MDTNNEDLKVYFLGISGISLPLDEMEISSGVTIRKIRRRVIQWVNVIPEEDDSTPYTGASSAEILHISAELELDFSKIEAKISNLEYVANVMSIFRIRIGPSIHFSVMSTSSFISKAESPQKVVLLEPRMGVVKRREIVPKSISQNHLLWIKSHLGSLTNLTTSSAEFKSLINAFDTYFLHITPKVAIPDLVGALEKLISPHPGELRFKIATYCSSFLEPPGDERMKLYKEYQKLYDIRSRVAHGGVMDSEGYTLVYSAIVPLLVKMILYEKVPTQEELLGSLIKGKGDYEELTDDWELNRSQS